MTGRFVLLGIFHLVLPVLVFYFLGMATANRTLQQEVRSRNLLYTKATAKRIDAVLRDLEVQLRTALTVTGDPTQELERVRNRLLASMSRNSLIHRAWLLDQEGQVLLRLPYEAGAIEEPVRRYFETVIWSRTSYLGDLEPTGYLYLAVPAMTIQDEFRGVLVVAISPNSLSDVLREVQLSANAFALLMDRQGVVIADTEERRIGTALADTPVGQELWLSRSGTLRIPFAGDEVIAAYQPLSWVPLGLAVAEPVRDALRPLRNLHLLLLQGVVVVVAVGLLAVWVISNRIARPLRQLIAAARAYGRGEPWRPLEIEGDDEVAQLALTMNDATADLDTARAQLIRQEKYLADILQGIPYCVITTDNRGVVTFGNRAAEELTGYVTGGILGRNMADLPLKENPEDWITLQALRDGAPDADVETYLLTRDGRRLTIRARASRLYDRDGQAIGTVTVFTDITEVRQLERLVQRSETLAAVGQLAAGMAHELKNPLAILSALAETVQEEQQRGESGSQLIREMLEEIARMDNLLRSLLELSPSDNRDRQPCQVQDLLDELLHLLRRQFQAQRITVERAYEPDLPGIMADRGRLRQAFLNVLLNAVEAMADGGRLQVQARLDRHLQALTVEIRDTGIGIPARRLARIFNPFYSTKQQGTGLGLAIVHEIVTEHGGLVRAESAKGQGTALIIEIPLQAAGPAIDGGEG